jgi:hypothetical protein
MLSEKLTKSLAERLSLYFSSRDRDASVSDVHFLASGFEREIHTFQLQHN